MRLNRLRVSAKLNLLVAVPLIAVVVTAVPFAADRVADAQSASTTAAAAKRARAVGQLISEIQRERILSLTYMSSAGTSGAPLAAQTRAVVDEANDLRRSLGRDEAPQLVVGLDQLQQLQFARTGVQRRDLAPEEVHDAFNKAVLGLIDGLQLARQDYQESAGGQQVSALDALLRANEANSSAGAGLIVAALVHEKPAAHGPLTLHAQRAVEGIHADRFRSLANDEQVRLLRQAENGEAAQAVGRYIAIVDDGVAHDEIHAVLNGAPQALVGLTDRRRLVQDHIARTIADRATDRANGATTAAIVFSGAALGLLALVIALSIAVSRSISDPLQRLTTAAGSVADLARAELQRVSDEERVQASPPRLAAIEVRSGGELGELATAFNRVQATAAMLLERQVAMRNNTGLMFANVGRRTQNLVGRQLTIIDGLEREEKDPEMLAKLYRLDHISARLRRSASSLMVVSGFRDDEEMVAKPTTLATVIRSSLSEIEGFPQVRLGEIASVTVDARVVGDLVLLLAELLENATSFSPPGAVVQVRTDIVHGGCLVSIVDHGIGMAPELMAEENRRLVERERLDIAPTSVLGLFVVGRLARRHGLAVRLMPTVAHGTTTQGVTAQVYVPDALLVARSPYPTASPGAIVTPTPLAIAQPVLSAIPALALPSAEPNLNFSWFPGARGGNGAAASDQPEEGGPDGGSGGVRPEHPVGPLGGPTAVPDQPIAMPGQPGPRHERPIAMPGEPRTPADAATGPRADFGDAGARLAGAGGPGRGGLTRRVPGAHLPSFEEGVLTPGGRSAAPPGAHRDRDPAADRLALDEFEAGAARAASEPAGPELIRPGSSPPQTDSLILPDSVRGAPPPVSPPPPGPPPPPRLRSSRPTGPGPRPSQLAPAGPDETHGGLTRRTPGAHLAAALRGEMPISDRPESVFRPPARDPELERAELEDFTAGITRALTETGEIPVTRDIPESGDIDESGDTASGPDHQEGRG